MSINRHPTVAGRFYPADPTTLRQQISRCLATTSCARPALATIGPHAGLRYSGEIAGATYAQVEVPQRVILIGPNHSGLGSAYAVWPAGYWLMPDSAIPIDEDLAAALCRYSPLHEDYAAHLREHSLEVQLPFLLAQQPELQIVPVCLGRLSEPECREIGIGIARAIRATAASGPALIVASTDMSHYLNAQDTAARDRVALGHVLELDPQGLHRTIEKQKISMCGYVPTVVALHAAIELGATRAKLIRYGHSGQVTGNNERVVGYAGVVID